MSPLNHPLQQAPQLYKLRLPHLRHLLNEEIVFIIFSWRSRQRILKRDRVSAFTPQILSTGDRKVEGHMRLYDVNTGTVAYGALLLRRTEDLGMQSAKTVLLFQTLMAVDTVAGIVKDPYDPFSQVLYNIDLSPAAARALRVRLQSDERLTGGWKGILPRGVESIAFLEPSSGIVKHSLTTFCLLEQPLMELCGPFGREDTFDVVQPH